MIAEEIDELLTEAFEHVKNGRYRMALTAAKKVYEYKPYDYKAVCCLAWCMLENGSAHQALELANSAVQLNPSARAYRGYLLMRMGIFEGAVSDLNKIIDDGTEVTSWVHLNKARALAGQEKYADGLKEVERSILLDPNDKELQQIREWFKTASGDNDNFLKGILLRRNLIEECEAALDQKEYWFSLWGSRQILQNKQLRKDHHNAYSIELESLLGMFQIRLAFEKAEGLKNYLAGDERFEKIYERIIKIFSNQDKKNESNDEPHEELLNHLEQYDNKFFTVYNARTYDLLENLKTGKRTYLLKFNADNIRYIGVEIVIDNPFYGNKAMMIDGIAVWYLNGTEMGSNSFELEIDKNWRSVEFIQSWGSDSAGFWRKGQGRVDIILHNNILCSRWFTVGDSELVNFEEVETGRQRDLSHEKPDTKQPAPVQERSSHQDKDESLEDLFDQLNTFIGLQSVKTSMRDFVDYLRFINERKKLGLKTQEGLSVHSVFLGNPGTGKTTIARLLGKIFKAMGLLKNGHVIEVDRTGLVGQYVGETAQKTDKVINEALGGLLFIDEAYTLKKDGNDFGQEAIDVLLKRMEDHAGEFVVIAAGYPAEMNSFINSNPGLKSRFAHSFTFEDYTPEELVKIFTLISSKEEYTVSGEALDVLSKNFIRLYRKRDSSFGNARLVRNIFNDAKLQISRRYLKLPEGERTKEAMTTILPEDITAVLGSSQKKQVSFGIDEALLEKCLDKINRLTGLKKVKKEIKELVKVAHFYNEQGINLNDKFSQHLVFLGNPGTGKTTVARLFSEIYSALGILPKGHLIECDRQALVGGYIGQTAEKTTRLIDSAIGGTLFIDEAYTLIKPGDGGNDFGKEAVDTLLKRMEDDRGKFIVIAAGYTGEMNSFLDSNPGLQSRFTQKIEFEDYNPEELMEITAAYLNEKGYVMDEDASPALLKYYTSLYKERDKSFGNARLVRNTIDTALKNHLLRIAEAPPEERHEEFLKLILLEDLSFTSDNNKSKPPQGKGNPERFQIYLDELQSLTGLQSVKRSVEKMITSLKVAQLREKRGLKIIPKNLNSVFMGNPGTGKSTTAGILGNLLREMGILDIGHLVEVDRSLLSGTYLGQSASKVDAAVKNAMGGILLINDAFTLGRDAGSETLDILIRKIDEISGRVIFIISGTEGEMKEFLYNNPLLQSRFQNEFYFEDYQPAELLEITDIISKKNGYKLDEEAYRLLLEIFNKLYAEKGFLAGNAVLVKDIFYKAVGNQEERILSLTNPNDEELCTITYQDVKQIGL